MTEHDNNLMSRKEFLKKSSTGLLAFSLFGKTPLQLSGSQKTETQTSPQCRVLGKTEIEVTTVGYGASRTMEPALVKIALDSGINFFDTGRIYYDGQNEVMVGKVIQGIRKEVIVQSKIIIRPRKKGEKLKSAEVSKKINNTMQSSMEKSLKALQTDYIDIMLIHGTNSIDIIHHETVMEFFRKAKEKGQIRACGFSSHTNQVDLLKAANESKFYDVIMVPYNHKGSYVHSQSGNYKEWNQPALEVELKKAEKNNIGIIAMKTCSAGPYSPNKESQPSYKEALKWILEHNYIHTMAVAMDNIEEIREDVQTMF